MQTKDPVLGNSGIYLFLQAYGDGWLEVGLMGVVSAMVGVGRSWGQPSPSGPLPWTRRSKLKEEADRA